MFFQFCYTLVQFGKRYINGIDNMSIFKFFLVSNVHYHSIRAVDHHDSLLWAYWSRWNFCDPSLDTQRHSRHPDTTTYEIEGVEYCRVHRGILVEGSDPDCQYEERDKDGVPCVGVPLYYQGDLDV